LWRWGRWRVWALAARPDWQPAELLAATVVTSVAGLLFQQANALAEAVTPRPAG
jgi:hypothetical protein